MVTVDDYASLLDPIRLNSTRIDLTHCPKRPPRMGAWAGGRLVSAKVATAPDCRYQIAPLTIDHEKGANRRRWISYGFIERLTMAAITQLSETRGFFARAHTFRNGGSINGCRGWVLAGRWGDAARGGAITLI